MICSRMSERRTKKKNTKGISIKEPMHATSGDNHLSTRKNRRNKSGRFFGMIKCFLLVFMCQGKKMKKRNKTCVVQLENASPPFLLSFLFLILRFDCVNVHY
jgi:hypothetical protein